MNREAIRPALRVLTSGASVSLTLSAISWLALLGWLLDGPWSLVVVFALLGVAASIVGLAAALIERTPLALFALAAGLPAPGLLWYWFSHLSPGAFD